jgi:hypothetical protein
VLSYVVGRSVPALEDVLPEVDFTPTRMTRSQLLEVFENDDTVLERHHFWSQGLP